jgi:5-(carboxyamino)imidazole ribonucleotide synthase
MTAIAPPACLGVLGGGQLGRYFVVAARTMGFRTMVLEPDAEAPAGAVADVHLVAAYDDPDALRRMASECAVVTTEFENPPAAALRTLAEQTLVRPSADAIAIAQDRRLEKRFLADAGIPVGPFTIVEDGAAPVPPGTAFPAILKTARLGYDGKGQAAVGQVGDLAPAWASLGGVPCVLEQRLPLDAEVSVVLARGPGGAIARYPVVANTHVDGILDLTVAPAPVDPAIAARAADLAVSIADALQYVGVLAVEMFVVAGDLLVNELAPRPHNSGHWTLDAARTSQFEQQVRAVCGLPLGDPGMAAPAAAMVNLLGDLWAAGEPRWEAALADSGSHLHLYGKRSARPGRKMGHLTVTAGSADEAAAAALACRRHARRDLQLDR